MEVSNQNFMTITEFINKGKKFKDNINIVIQNILQHIKIIDNKQYIILNDYMIYYLFDIHFKKFTKMCKSKKSDTIKYNIDSIYINYIDFISLLYKKGNDDVKLYLTNLPQICFEYDKFLLERHMNILKNRTQNK